MALLRLLKYSSVLLFFRRYRFRLFRIFAAVLFAAVTSLLYTDVQAYLELRYPGALIYALTVKIIIVYGALIFVLWQFRPVPEQRSGSGRRPPAQTNPEHKTSPTDRLSSLEDIDRKSALRSRYDAMLEKHGPDAENK